MNCAWAPKLREQAARLKPVGYTRVTTAQGKRYLTRNGQRVELPSSGRNVAITGGARAPAPESDLSTVALLAPYLRLLEKGVPQGAVRLKMAHDAAAGLATARARDALEAHLGPVEETTAVIPTKGMHGLAGKAHWKDPRVATECYATARPGYNSGCAHEFVDAPDVLGEKVHMLAALLRKAKRVVVYAGAGLSTSSGVADYATRAPGLSTTTTTKGAPQKLTSPLMAEPNAGHRALAKLAEAGFIYRFVQQNHDGLPQKAGCPQRVMNEIHGSWFDPSNPVVPMSGNLRSDLFQDLADCAKSADLVLALGSSLCGMNADRLVDECAKRAAYGSALGAVVVNLQKTPYDHRATLRVNGLLDDVLTRLVDELRDDIPLRSPVLTGKPPKAMPIDPAVDVFSVPYDANGHLDKASKRRNLDLRPGARLVVGFGAHQGCPAKVLGKNIHNQYRIAVTLQGTHNRTVPRVYHLGPWMIQAALDGDLKTLPVISP